MKKHSQDSCINKEKVKEQQSDIVLYIVNKARHTLETICPDQRCEWNLGILFARYSG